ncbi:MAG: hypothetical protein WEC17_00645, partial [Candidatus Saccharimonadales bacterium]
MIDRAFRLFKNQQGIASIIVVFIITILITLVSLGFARLMDRALQNVTSNQLGAAADYAAQSGLNDAIAEVKKNPLLTASDCNTLTGPSGLLEAKKVLSASGPTEYTCVLIDPVPGDLEFQNILAYNSQVIKLQPDSGNLLKVMFSWEATAASSQNSSASFPNFLSENSWGLRRPVLRVTLYPVGSGGALRPVSESRTYYLYPSSGGTQVGSVSYGSPSGTIVRGNCSSQNTAGLFNGSADKACNVVISGLNTSVPYYIARITPIYKTADVIIKANNGSNEAVKFEGAQSVIDVTGKSNTAVKRIQARVSTGGIGGINAGDNSIPEDAIRSANTICKRIIVPSDPGLSNYVLMDPTSIANSPICGFFTNTIPAPTVNLTANPTTVTVGSSSTLTWTVTTVGPTTCTASNDGGLSTWTGSKSAAGGSQSTGALNSVRSYIFTLSCSNAGGSNSDSATVTVNPRAPVVTLTANPTSVTVGGNSNLTWTVANGATSCTASNDAGLASWTGSKPTGGGLQNTGPLNTVRVYNFTLTCSNVTGSASDSASVTTNPVPPPPPPPPPPGP